MKKTVEETEKAGRKAHSTALDLRENENCKKAVDEHIIKGLLVSCAGYMGNPQLCRLVVDVGNTSRIEPVIRV